MDKSDGWVKIYRSIQEQSWYQDSEAVHLFIHFILKANHSTGRKVNFDGHVIELLPGQFISGRKVLAKETGINESKVNRLIKRFKSEQQIEQVTGSKNSLFTMLSWDKHQKGEQVIEQQTNSKRTGSEQVVNSKRTGSEHKQELRIKNSELNNERINNSESEDPAQAPNAPSKKNKAKKILFRESEFFGHPEKLAEALAGTSYKDANAKYYCERALNWSDSKQERKTAWLAALKNWMLDDMANGKFIKNDYQPSQNNGRAPTGANVSTSSILNRINSMKIPGDIDYSVPI